MVELVKDSHDKTGYLISKDAKYITNNKINVAIKIV